MQIRAFEEADAQHWDEFCENAIQATLLHTRLFLSYHGSRFKDQSLIIHDQGKLIGLLPAALDPTDGSCVITHPGATYGGIVHQGYLRGEMMIHALTACCNYYESKGILRLRYKAVPAFYHTQPAQDDLYALYRLSANRYRCDLSSTIDLSSRSPLGERRRRSLKKAQKNNVRITDDLSWLPALWQVLEENLARKHDTKPVHTVAEISMLIGRFPDRIKVICALHNEQVVAGVVLFITNNCYHAQYIAASEEGYDLSGLDAVFDYCISKAEIEKKRWFDFGISTESSGNVLNNGLYRFKTEFGGGGTIHEFFEIMLGGE